MNTEYYEDLKERFEFLIHFVGTMLDGRKSQSHTTEYHELEFLYGGLCNLEKFVLETQQEVGGKGTKEGE